MSERLFGTNQHYQDNGDFTQKYFYQLRGCVPPIIKRAEQEQCHSKPATGSKSKRELVMDAARKKVNQRYKRK